jgi:hypothetical protein
MAKKCDWCHASSSEMQVKEVAFKSSTEEITICCQECEDRLVTFSRYVESHVWHFFAGLLLLPAIGGVLAVWRESIDNGALGYLVMGVGMGAAIIKYPFVTPQTVQLLGMKKGILLGRMTGALLVLAGIGLFVYCNWFVSA